MIMVIRYDLLAESDEWLRIEGIVTKTTRSIFDLFL